MSGVFLELLASIGGYRAVLWISRARRVQSWRDYYLCRCREILCKLVKRVCLLVLDMYIRAHRKKSLKRLFVGENSSGNSEGVN